MLLIKTSCHDMLWQCNDSLNHTPSNKVLPYFLMKLCCHLYDIKLTCNSTALPFWKCATFVLFWHVNVKLRMRLADQPQTHFLPSSTFWLLFLFNIQCSACRTVKRNTVFWGQTCLEGICSLCLYTKMLNKISLYLHRMRCLIFFFNLIIKCAGW